ncbi:hypothetical protein Nepgr_004121 [Nepenthes gracilis]|uniref:Uncharacterized protein n=1 Tax=Nepenthes gracilis TaxID=150966 RepID=A0AAD3S0S3_NEPGR|nr:hypothetical protein Nepgr_004121 [Nepenthes gracilis]
MHKAVEKDPATEAFHKALKKLVKRDEESSPLDETSHRVQFKRMKPPPRITQLPYLPFLRPKKQSPQAAIKPSL